MCNRSDGEQIEDREAYIVKIENTFSFDDCPALIPEGYIKVSYQLNRDTPVELGPSQNGFYTKTTDETDTLAIGWSWSGDGEKGDTPLGSVTLTLTKTGRL